MFERLKAWWKRLRTPRPEYRMSVTPDGVQFVSDDGERKGFPFADVKHIFAYKVDLFSVDLICLGFRTDDSGEFWEVDEEMPAYPALLLHLERIFGIREEAWWRRVAVPAFERNYTTLWGEEFDWDKAAKQGSEGDPGRPLSKA